MTDFGRDTSCTTALRAGQFVSGTRLVAEAAYRRLTTPRGTLLGGEEEAHYGLDLSNLIGSVQSKSDVLAFAGQVQNELLKDERIDTVDVTPTLEQSGPSVAVNLTIVGTTKLGPFSLVVRVTDVTTQLLGISEVT